MAVSIPNGDGRVNSRIENYTAFFDKNSVHDSEEHKKNRLENYTDVVNGTARNSGRVCTPSDFVENFG